MQDSCQQLIQQHDSPQDWLLGSGGLAIAGLGRCGPLPPSDNGNGDSSEQSKLSLVTEPLPRDNSNKTSKKSESQSSTCNWHKHSSQKMRFSDNRGSI